VGSKWKIFVPPMLAYGRGGVDKMIPPNKLLIFEIELLAIEKQEESKDQQG
jgi:FKBP-type peptidyl-prolyl cis-trans isomerase